MIDQPAPKLKIVSFYNWLWVFHVANASEAGVYYSIFAAIVKIS